MINKYLVLCPFQRSLEEETREEGKQTGSSGQDGAAPSLAWLWLRLTINMVVVMVVVMIVIMIVVVVVL